MNRKLRGIWIIALAFITATAVVSCTSYGYTLVAYNETTAKQRDHEFVGTIVVEIKPTAELFKDGKGVRAEIMEEARAQYGDDIDDVINVSSSQTYTPAGGAMSTYYFIIRGDVVRYTE